MQKKLLKRKIIDKIRVGVFISNEGFGHSVRQKTIIKEFLKIKPNSEFTVFNYKRLSFLKEYFGNRINYVSYPDTLSTIKNTNGELDITLTKKILERWPVKSNNAIKFLKKKKFIFDIIISDLVPEAFRYAKTENIPSFGVARFTWDWFFYNSKLKSLNSLKLISRDLKLSNKIYFPTFTNGKILSNHFFLTKKTNLILNKNLFKENTFDFAKSKNKYKCLIMDNGTKTNSELIKKTIVYLKKIKYIDFYIAVDNYSNNLKNYIAEQINLIPVSGLKNMHRLIEYVDFLVARGGFNTLTEILIFKKPALLIDEKNNPEIRQNLLQMNNLGYSAIMKQSSFKSKFPNRINYFLKKEMTNIKNKLNVKNFQSNGAKQIVKDIIKIYEKS
tara:strand:- start:3672 stop:4832 length:1161 start_codon:yes stop_codon:yes gene_type:complete